MANQSKVTTATNLFLTEKIWEMDLIKYNPELRLEILRIIFLEFPIFCKINFPVIS